MGTRFPFSSFPDGWFAIGYSDELTPGGVKPIRALGRDLVLYRSESGVARAFDAYCPHMGTHLGHGGTVSRECIRCPFHAWRFDEHGACVEVPDAAKIPPRAQLAPWLVRERNGVILVHHDHRGLQPAFEIPEAPELAGAGWSAPLRFNWTIRTHVQEICENLADVSHFHHLHGQTRPKVVRNVTDNAHYNIVLETDGNRLDMSLFGLGVELSHLHVNALADGDWFFAAKFMTPIDEEQSELRVLCAAKVTGDAGEADRRAELFNGVTKAALMQDVPIWENKRYQGAPLLSSDDGPIPLFRRWAKQFYPA